MVLLVLVTFLLSNRETESLSLWPFGFLAALPVGAVMIAVLVFGFLGGLAAQVPKRYGARKRLKKAEKRIAELEAKLAITAVPSTEGRGAGRGVTLLTPAGPPTIAP